MLTCLPQNLAALIAHTRTYSIFPLFAARISLHHAHLAHALNQTSRALDCYRVAAALAEDGSFVYLSAKAGETVLRITIQAKGSPPDAARPEPVDVKEAQRLAMACRNMGGTLEAVGKVIEALVSREILGAKYAIYVPWVLLFTC